MRRKSDFVDKERASERDWDCDIEEEGGWKTGLRGWGRGGGVYFLWEVCL